MVSVSPPPRNSPFQTKSPEYNVHLKSTLYEQTVEGSTPPNSARFLRRQSLFMANNNHMFEEWLFTFQTYRPTVLKTTYKPTDLPTNQRRGSNPRLQCHFQVADHFSSWPISELRWGKDHTMDVDILNFSFYDSMQQRHFKMQIFNGLSCNRRTEVVCLHNCWSHALKSC